MAQAASELYEPFTSRPREREAVVFALWIFLASELLLFGGLFLGYAVYRFIDTTTFTEAARHTNIVFGTANTAILMTSSLSIAVAGRALEAGKSPAITRLGIWITILLGLSFIVVKGFEYSADLHEHLWPGLDFSLKPPTARIFWSFYWITTGVHACHVTVGLIFIGRLAWIAHRRVLEVSKDSVEATSLYWHLVDIIWVILYPLLYLVGR